MSLTALVAQPGSLVCLARRPPQYGEASALKREVSLQICGALGSETLFVYPVGLDSTVGELKLAIQRIEGTPVREQRLIVRGQRLDGDVPGETRDHLPLREALGDALPVSPAADDVVDVTLVRLPPAWAEALDGLRRGHTALARLDEADRADRELVLAAVSHRGDALAQASEELRADRQVVMAALRQDPAALRFAAPELQDDREVALTAVKLSGQALQHVSEARKSDKEVVLAAMASSWRSLQHASPELRRDPSFVLTAVKEHGSALLFASPELRGDREIVLAAVQRSGWALSCASDELKSDRACVLAAVSSNPAALDFAVDSLRGDPEVVALVATASGRRVSAPCGHGPPLPCAVL